MKKLIFLVLSMMMFNSIGWAEDAGISSELLFGNERRKLALQEDIQHYLQKQMNQSFTKGEIQVAAKIRWKTGGGSAAGNAVRLGNLDISAPGMSAESSGKSLVDSIHSIDVSLFFPGWVNEETIEAYRGQVYTFIPLVAKSKINVWGFRVQEPPKSFRDYFEDPGFLKMLMIGGMFFLLIVVITMLFMDNPAPTRVVVQMPKSEPVSAQRGLVPVAMGNVVRMAPDYSDDPADDDDDRK